MPVALYPSSSDFLGPFLYTAMFLFWACLLLILFLLEAPYNAIYLELFYGAL